MTHMNEVKAFDRGAEATRSLCIAYLEKTAENRRTVGKACRNEADRILLTLEATSLSECAAHLRDMPLPDFDES